VCATKLTSVTAGINTVYSDKAVKQLVHYHIARLKDKNPTVRLKAINELALLGDAEALDVLKAVFRDDADAEVRKAAQEAGRTIFLKQRENQESQSSS
jgi:HEAT repeat protein